MTTKTSWLLVGGDDVGGVFFCGVVLGFLEGLKAGGGGGGGGGVAESFVDTGEEELDGGLVGRLGLGGLEFGQSLFGVAGLQQSAGAIDAGLGEIGALLEGGVDLVEDVFG